MIRVKRVYAPYEETDGLRILVDRLWPRGLTKEKAHVDLWMKEIAPSDSLRREFHHQSNRWEEFRKRYHRELAHKGDLVEKIRQIEREKGVVTLLFASRDEARNNAVALLQFLTSPE
ncbi:MAG: DUF488 family protein [Candidatus Atribacteria bacterium]|nr:DUF488 family protein [Candidatus Atribacteria bacterium]